MRISALASGHNAILLDDGEAMAFVDRDWIPDRGGVVPGLVVDNDGALWWRERKLTAADTEDPTALPAQLVSALADDLVSQVRDVAQGAVEVTGRGVTADEVRLRLAGQLANGSSAQAVIELTGKISELLRVTGAVVDGGIVVLAGEYVGPVELNMYTDVHRRGLRVIGVPDIGFERETPSDREGPPEPVSVLNGQELPFASWYRITR